MRLRRVFFAARILAAKILLFNGDFLLSCGKKSGLIGNFRFAALKACFFFNSGVIC